MQSQHSQPRSAKSQQGVSLIFALVALVALMLGALAMVRNVDSGTQLLGNLGFKQDATAAADQATRQAIAWLNVNAASLTVDIPESGYYASSREFDDDGVTPLGPIDVTGQQYVGTATRQLIDWDANECASAAKASYADCSMTRSLIDEPINGNTASYVILRLCNKTGDYATDSTIKCARPLTAGEAGATGRGEISYSEAARYTTNSTTYFRVLVRVQGFRNTTSVTETIVHF